MNNKSEIECKSKMNRLHLITTTNFIKSQLTEMLMSCRKFLGINGTLRIEECSYDIN